MSINFTKAYQFDMNVLQLEADLYKALNDYREVFDQYVDRYPLVEINPSNTEIVKSYHNGLKNLNEGMQLVLKAFEELCSLKRVAV